MSTMFAVTQWVSDMQLDASYISDYYVATLENIIVPCQLANNETI